MSHPTLECSGLACPHPVLQCKQCVDNESPNRLTVIVDNEAARENVTRYLSSRGYEVSSDATGGSWRITGHREEQTAEPCGCVVMDDAALAAMEQRICVFLAAATIGSGNDELGSKLMAAFLGTLPEMGQELWRLVLLNGAVKMTVPGHPCFEKLAALADAGVDILVCGTCLDFFGLLEQKGVGQTTNMLDIVTSLQLASKVIHV